MRALATTPEPREACSRAATRRGLAAAPRRVEVDLSPQAMERIAGRVAEMLGERQDEGAAKLISAGELALRLGVERPWVYRHRELLGGIRMGAGPKAPWRFEYRKAIEALQGPRNTATRIEKTRRSR